jgi:hypothetical protein
LISRGALIEAPTFELIDFDTSFERKTTLANWYGFSRSNYFKVKDREQFEAWVDGIDDLEILAENDGRFAINGAWYGGWPHARCHDERNDTPIDLACELSAHLEEGEIAVLLQAGAEKLRYITGDALAVNHRGEQVTLSLDDIYGLAKTAFGGVPSDASY